METPAHLIEKFVVSADGTRVYAGALGDPRKPALVFVHGMTLSGSIFNDLFSLPELSEDFYLVRFDLRGHGRTGKPDVLEGYSSQKHAEDFAAVVKEFNAKTPILVGWSWGGTIAGDVASHLPPGSMLGAVYIASHPTLSSSLPADIQPGFALIWQKVVNDSDAVHDFPISFNRLCFARDSNPPMNSLEETVKLHKEGYDFVAENPAATYEIRLGALGMMTSMSVVHRRLSTQHLNDDKILDLLSEGFPILEVIGTHDAFLNCRTLVESLKPIARNLEVHIVEGASHTPFVDAPEEVVAAVTRFAKRVHTQSGSI